jgi:hypothetical protein
MKCIGAAHMMFSFLSTHGAPCSSAPTRTASSGGAARHTRRTLFVSLGAPMDKLQQPHLRQRSALAARCTTSHAPAKHLQHSRSAHTPLPTPPKLCQPCRCTAASGFPHSRPQMPSHTALLAHRTALTHCTLPGRGHEACAAGALSSPSCTTPRRTGKQAWRRPAKRSPSRPRRSLGALLPGGPTRSTSCAS